MVIYIASTWLFDVQCVIKHELERERIDLLQAAVSVIWHELIFHRVENIVFVHFFFFKEKDVYSRQHLFLFVVLLIVEHNSSFVLVSFIFTGLFGKRFVYIFRVIFFLISAPEKFCFLSQSHPKDSDG